MKNSLNKAMIIETAVKMADEKGLPGVTMKALAMKLGVESSSLYKHIKGGLDELYEGLMLYGWTTLDNKIARALAGKSRDDAIRAMCSAFRDFALQHPGVFEVMQWHNSYTNELNKQATKGIITSLYQTLEAYHMSYEQKLHTLRMLRGFVQGFALIETHGGFGDPISTDNSFEFAVKMLVNGINALESES